MSERLYCMGGPAHGNLANDVGMVLYYQLPDPHHHMNVRPKSLKPCLELQEIQALTGSECHRDPNRFIAEDFERKQTLTRHYLKQRFTDGRNVISAYVWEGYQPSQENLMAAFRAAQPA